MRHDARDNLFAVDFEPFDDGEKLAVLFASESPLAAMEVQDSFEDHCCEGGCIVSFHQFCSHLVQLLFVPALQLVHETDDGVVFRVVGRADKRVVDVSWREPRACCVPLGGLNRAM